MKKKMFLTVMLLGLFVPMVLALTEAGNKFCPVSGDPVSGKDFVEVEGTRYGLCCSMCSGSFKKDPAKYIAKMKEQEAKGVGQGGGMGM